MYCATENKAKCPGYKVGSIPEEQMCCRLYRSNVFRCSVLTVDPVLFDKVVHLPYST